MNEKKNDRNKFNFRLYNLRRQSGLTQAEFALATGISQSQANKLEHGERNMTIQWAQKAAEILQCDVIDILPNDMLHEIKSIVQVYDEANNDNRKIKVFKCEKSINNYYISDRIFASISDLNEAYNNIYGILVFDNTMKPRYKQGQIVCIGPGRELYPGCGAVIKYNDGRVLICEWLRWVDDGAMINNYQFGEMFVNMDEVNLIEPIVATLEVI